MARLPVSALLADPALARSLRAFSGGASVVRYAIQTAAGYLPVAGNRGMVMATPPAVARFIDQVFRWVDARIRPDFTRQAGVAGSAIDVYRVRHVIGANPFTVGMTSTLEDHFDVQWRETDGRDKLTWSERATIVHELGHTLGLSHPQNRPYDRRWSTRDTIMSYNEDRSRNPWFSSTDLQALQQLWGPEPTPVAAARLAPAAALKETASARAWENSPWWGAASPTGLEGWSSG